METPEHHADPAAPDRAGKPARVVVIAASAGGLHAISRLLADLPAAFPAPILVVQHLSPSRPSLMAEILSRRISLPVKQAEASDIVRAGAVYIARPDWHLRLNADHTLTLTQTAREQFVRPSANQLFESAARGFGAGVTAVILTGTGRDGAEGVVAVKRMGGLVIAQDDATSAHVAMPHAAIDTGAVDWILPLDEIAPKLLALVTGGETR